jgi:hypothetical protein
VSALYGRYPIWFPLSMGLIPLNASVHREDIFDKLKGHMDVEAE